MLGEAIALFALGAILGSFLNVVVYRLPRSESLSHPGSRCPSCEAPVKPYDNIPIFSWIVLRGRCRHCRATISPRYPLVEALTGGLFLAAYLILDAPEDLWPGLVLIVALVPVIFIDLEHRIIPNKIMLPAALAGVALAASLRTDDLPEFLIAGAAAGGFLLIVALIYPRGMGMGDVKLAGVMGLYLGRAVAPAMLIGFLAGTIIGIAIMARQGVGARKQAVPFGPFLAFGALVGLFAGDEIVDWYLDTFA